MQQSFDRGATAPSRCPILPPGQAEAVVQARRSQGPHSRDAPRASRRRCRPTRSRRGSRSGAKRRRRVAQPRLSEPRCCFATPQPGGFSAGRAAAAELASPLCGGATSAAHVRSPVARPPSAGPAVCFKRPTRDAGSTVRLPPASSTMAWL